MRLWTSSILGSDTQLNQGSYYEASVQRPTGVAPLQGGVEADVLVVGAGFAGLSAAIELAQRGYRVVVLEAERACAGRAQWSSQDFARSAHPGRGDGRRSARHHPCG